MTKRQQQWMEVGRAFEGQGPTADLGLCSALERAGRVERAGRDGVVVCLPVMLREARGGFDEYSAFWFPTRRSRFFIPEYDNLRALWAYLMAAMTDRERDAIVEGL